MTGAGSIISGTDFACSIAGIVGAAATAPYVAEMLSSYPPCVQSGSSSSSAELITIRSTPNSATITPPPTIQMAIPTQSVVLSDSALSRTSDVVRFRVTGISKDAASSTELDIAHRVT